MGKQSSNKARFTTRYTEAQKRAVLLAHFVDGHPPRTVARMAANGQLGVAAFELGDYVYKLIDRNRETYEATVPEALDRAVAIEMKGAELDALSALREARRAMRRGEANTTRLATATKDLAAIRKARRDSANTTKPTRETQQHTNENADASQAVLKTDATLTSLLNLAEPPTKQGARTGSLAHTSNGTAPDAGLNTAA